MSKIYDALEHARRKLKEGQVTPEPFSDGAMGPAESPSIALSPEPSIEKPDEQPVDFGPEIPAETSALFQVKPTPSMPIDGLDIEGEMISLYQSIDSLLPHIPHKVVLFVGSRTGEGTSTMVRELARVASLKLGKSVLIVDLDRSRPELKYFINARLDYNLEEIINGEVPIEKAFCHIEEDKLYVSPLFQQSMRNPQALDTAKTSNSFWDQLRNRFDLVIIDSPPATLYSDGPYIARQADGVILVVEAEKTSWPVVLSVKEKILKHGGNILGIVFNKRRFYIPRFIYKRL
jgi:protein-tyrosine kinase